MVFASAFLDAGYRYPKNITIGCSEFIAVTGLRIYNAQSL